MNGRGAATRLCGFVICRAEKRNGKKNTNKNRKRNASDIMMVMTIRCREKKKTKITRGQ